MIDFVDYVEENNRIMCDMLQEWQRGFNSQKHHLIATLQEVFRLYTKMPPVPIEEAFADTGNANSLAGLMHHSAADVYPKREP